MGTTCAELAGIAASLELVDVPPWLSVPVAAVGVTAVVVFETFERLEHVLLALSAVFVAYIGAGLLAHPDWVCPHGLVVPSMPLGKQAALVATATVGTTLAPWGLAFIQSYAVDKRLSKRDLPASESTSSSARSRRSHRRVRGHRVRGDTVSARDHRRRRERRSEGPRATGRRRIDMLFGVGLLGAGLLAAAVVPLSTSYSVSETFGREPTSTSGPGRIRCFYGTFCLVMAAAALIVMIPGAPLVDILFLTQALNAILLLPLLLLMLVLARDRELPGRWRQPWNLVDPRARRGSHRRLCGRDTRRTLDRSYGCSSFRLDATPVASGRPPRCCCRPASCTNAA